MVIAIVVPFILTFLLGKRKGVDKQAAADAAAEEAAEKAVAEHAPVELKAFLSGKLVPIDQVPDQTFAEKILGDGVAIDPTDSTLLAPADATVTQVMEGSNHALGLTLDNGLEILLHIGLDTVAMNGDGFTSFVKQGDRVKAGQKLIGFDPEKIKAAGHPLITMLVITDPAGYEKIGFHAEGSAEAGKTVIVNVE